MSLAIGGAAAYCAFFLWFAADGLRSWFSGDDLMNLYHYWTQPLARLLGGFAPHSTFFRPSGGLFYRGIHALFGFSALPFRVAALAVCMANLWLMYRSAAMLAGSREAGAIVLVLGGTHAALVHLYYDTGMIFDVLAFVFYYLTLVAYISVRGAGRVPGAVTTILLTAGALFAIKAKEIAVTLPAALLMYEIIWHGLPRNLRWFAGAGRMVAVTALLAAWTVGGRFLAADPLLSHPGYAPVFSLRTYLQTCGNYLGQLLYRPEPLSEGLVAAGLIAMAGLAAISRRKEMLWAAAMAAVAPLPVAFIPPRNGFAFVVPAFPFLLYAAALLVWLRDVALRRFAGRRAGLVVQTATIALVAAVVLPEHARMFRYPLAVIHDVQDKNRRYQDQLFEVLPEIRRGASVLVLNDPYAKEIQDTQFLIWLSYGDPTIRIDRRKGFPDQQRQQLEHYDYVLDFRDGKFVRVE